jgi:hypothetical protein
MACSVLTLDVIVDSNLTDRGTRSAAESTETSGLEVLYPRPGHTLLNYLNTSPPPSR